MNIKKIKLNNYRNFKEHQMEFDNGTNIINGDNGTGKSGIFEAMAELMLFDFNIYRKNFYDLSEPYKISLEFEHNNEFFNIYKDTNENLFYIEYEEKKYFKENALELFKKKTGVDLNSRVYRALFFMQQRDWIYYFDKGKHIKSVSDIIKSYLSKGDLNSESDISKKIRDNRKSVSDELKEEREKLEDIKEELEEIRAFVVEKEINFNILNRLKKELSDIEKKILKKDFLFKAYNDYANLKKEFTDLAEKTTELREKIEKIEKLEERKIFLENKLENYKNFTLEKIEEISRISGILDNKNQEILKEEYKRAISNLLVYKNICYSICLVFTLVAIIGSFFSLYFSSFVIFSGIFGLLGIYFLQKAREEERKMQIDIQTVYSREVQGLNNELIKILAQANVSTVEEYKERFRSREDLMKNLENLKKELSLLYEEKTLEMLEEEYKGLGLNIRDMKEKLDSVKNDGRNKEIEVEVIKDELDKSIERRDEISKEINNIITMISKNKYSSQDLYEKEEIFYCINNRIEELEKELNVLGFVDDYYKRAHMDIMESANSLLDITIDKYFSVLTANEFQDVKVEFTSEKELHFNVYSNKFKKFVKEDFLSDSAFDALFIAFRFALIELIDYEGNIPLFMDEVYSFFDKNKLDNCQEVFKNISFNRQIFYFNSNPYIEDLLNDNKSINSIKIKK